MARRPTPSEAATQLTALAEANDEGNRRSPTTMEKAESASDVEHGPEPETSEDESSAAENGEAENAAACPEEPQIEAARSSQEQLREERGDDTEVPEEASAAPLVASSSNEPCRTDFDSPLHRFPQPFGRLHVNSRELIIAVLASMDPYMSEFYLRRLTCRATYNAVNARVAQNAAVSDAFAPEPSPQLPASIAEDCNRPKEDYVIFVSNIPTQDERRYAKETQPRRRAPRPQSLYECVRRKTKEAFQDFFYERQVYVTDFQMFCDHRGQLTGAARMSVATEEMYKAVLRRSHYRVNGRNVVVKPFNHTPLNVKDPLELLLRNEPCVAPFCPYSTFPTDHVLLMLAGQRNHSTGAVVCSCARSQVRNFYSARLQILLRQLSDSTPASDKRLRAFLQLSPNLQRLHIRLNPSRIGVDRLEADFPSFLSRCCPFLQELELVNVHLNGSALRRRTIPTNAELAELKKLVLRNVLHLKQRGLVCLLRCYANSLEVLEVANIDLFRPVDIVMPHLHRLDLAHLHLTEDSLRSVLAFCGSLKRLSLVGVSLISEEHGPPLAAHPLRLEALSINGGATTSKCLRQLLHSCSRLVSLVLVNLRFVDERIWTLDLSQLSCAPVLCDLELRASVELSPRLAGNFATYRSLNSLELSATFRQQQAMDLVESFVQYCPRGNTCLLHEITQSRMNFEATVESYEDFRSRLGPILCERMPEWSTIIGSVEIQEGLGGSRCVTLPLIDYF